MLYWILTEIVTNLGCIGMYFERILEGIRLHWRETRAGVGFIWMKLMTEIRSIAIWHQDHWNPKAHRRAPVHTGCGPTISSQLPFPVAWLQKGACATTRKSSPRTSLGLSASSLALSWTTTVLAIRRKIPSDATRAPPPAVPEMPAAEITRQP